LYAQTPAAISRLTHEHVQTTGHAVHLRLGREPVTLPEPLASLTASLLTRRRGHAALGDQGTSPWLFPGGRPSQPISAYPLPPPPTPPPPPPHPTPPPPLVPPPPQPPPPGPRRPARHPHKAPSPRPTPPPRQLTHPRPRLHPPQTSPRRRHRTGPSARR